MIKVIIFDLDGLLIDSQPLQYKAYNQVFSKHGFPLSLDDWREWIHNSYRTNQWIQKNHLPLNVDLVRAEKKKIYDKLVRNELKLKPGALSLINNLYGSFRLCIASSSRLESIELVLEKFGLKSKFEKLVSDTEMIKGKPYPDIFLKTAEIMRARPEECLVIEDSVAGLKAAKAAGIKCVICPDSFGAIEPVKFKGAYKIVKNLNEITSEMLENIS
ncbi:MAG: HAD family phosphatase [Candidatus Gracilibacteria bacterium]